MSASENHDVEYDSIVPLCELVWGEGFLSPGGPAEVSLVLEGLDLHGKAVLDIGCAVGGIDRLLVREHGAASVLGIDVDGALIRRAQALAAREGLTGRMTFRQVEPGPLPFGDASFDVVFSKDSMIHIPDKEALFAEVYRVLRPGGVVVASDWLRRDDDPPTPEMQRYIELEGLGFGMGSPARYCRALEAAGFHGIQMLDRNAWYRNLAQQEVAQLGGPLRERLVQLCGEELAAREIAVWEAMIVVLESGELRPGHFRAWK